LCEEAEIGSMKNVTRYGASFAPLFASRSDQPGRCRTLLKDGTSPDKAKAKKTELFEGFGSGTEDGWQVVGEEEIGRLTAFVCRRWLRGATP